MKTTPERNSIAPQAEFFRDMKSLTAKVKTRQLGDRGLWQPAGKPSQSDEELTAQEFEKALWDDYGLTGEIVPDELLKECQRRLRNSDPNSDSRLETEEELQFLDQLHQY